MTADIFNRIKNLEAVPFSDPDYHQIGDACAETRALVMQMNQTADRGEIRNLLSEITGTEVDPSVTVFTPLHINYGKNLTLGKNIFINFDCILLDLGGIEIQDGVMLAPGVKLLSEGHPVERCSRNQLTAGKITIKKNAWIGAGVTILQGVTVGENAVVASGAVVSQNVPDNSVVGGIPAKVIRKL